MSLPQNVIIVTVPRYYREIFSIPAVITVVTAVFPHYHVIL